MLLKWNNQFLRYFQLPTSIFLWKNVKKVQHMIVRRYQIIFILLGKVSPFESLVPQWVLNTFQNVLQRREYFTAENESYH